jgi:hypothetical protein
MAHIRPKLAWRVGPLVVGALLVIFGASAGAYTIAAFCVLFAIYAWTTTLEVAADAIEKRPWGRGHERVARPVAELAYISVPTIARRAIEIGPMGSSITLELGFWHHGGLTALVRDLVVEAHDLGDDDSRARILRYAGAV